MHVVYERCCGIDVHKKFVVVCLCILTAQGAIQKEIRTFTTMTRDLLGMLEWLKQAGCSHAALESTGVYWKPIHNLLETELEVLLINAQHMKAIPGCKTDMKDAEWIADLLQHGLLRASFIPPRPQRELRELTRYRARLVGERARLVNRIQKILEDTNIKLAAVVTDISGASARAMLHALLTGQTDPQQLASLARGRLRKKKEQLEEALQGTLKDHHRFLLVNQLRHLDLLDQQIATFDREIAHRVGIDHSRTKPETADGKEPSGTPVSSAQEKAEQVQPVSALDREQEDRPEVARELHPPEPEPPAEWKRAAESPANNQEPAEPLEEQATSSGGQTEEEYARAIAILDGVTGINERIAQIIVAEIGIDMRPFPSEAHLASWVGLCPGTKISAGKRLSGKTQKGDQWLRQALIEAAHGAARSKGTYLGALYQRLAKRLGRKKAIVALAHRILLIIYHLLKEQEPYQERGEAYVQQREHEDLKLQAIRRLQRLGYEVSLAESKIA
jgi:transposase